MTTPADKYKRYYAGELIRTTGRGSPLQRLLEAIVDKLEDLDERLETLSEKVWYPEGRDD